MAENSDDPKIEIDLSELDSLYSEVGDLRNTNSALVKDRDRLLAERDVFLSMIFAAISRRQPIASIVTMAGAGRWRRAEADPVGHFSHYFNIRYGLRSCHEDFPPKAVCFDLPYGRHPYGTKIRPYFAIIIDELLLKPQSIPPSFMVVQRSHPKLVGAEASATRPNRKWLLLTHSNLTVQSPLICRLRISRNRELDLLDIGKNGVEIRLQLRIPPMQRRILVRGVGLNPQRYPAAAAVDDKEAKTLRGDCDRLPLRRRQSQGSDGKRARQRETAAHRKDAGIGRLSRRRVSVECVGRIGDARRQELRWDGDRDGVVDAVRDFNVIELAGVVRQH
jgi:hypothetical protein